MKRVVGGASVAELFGGSSSIGGGKAHVRTESPDCDVPTPMDPFFQQSFGKRMGSAEVGPWPTYCVRGRDQCA
jgi:hypothetical protein